MNETFKTSDIYYQAYLDMMGVKALSEIHDGTRLFREYPNSASFFAKKFRYSSCHAYVMAILKIKSTINKYNKSQRPN